MTIGIYCIKNNVNGKVYIGSAKNISKRWMTHRSLLIKGKHHSIKLQRSWSKYGESAFSFDILEEVEDVLLLTEREQFWIDTTNSVDGGYNIAPKARSSLGRKHPPEVLLKMSLAKKGKKTLPFSDTHCAALSESRIGNQWSKGISKSEEHKQKLSLVMKGRKNPAVSESNKTRKGKKCGPLSPETKAKLSEACKKRWQDEEYKNMMREKFKAVPGEKRSHPCSEETKERLRKPHKTNKEK